MKSELKIAVERMYACKASFIEDIVVIEKGAFRKRYHWNGIVSVLFIKVAIPRLRRLTLTVVSD